MSIKNRATWKPVHPSSIHVHDVSRPSRLCGWQRDWKTGTYNTWNTHILGWIRN